MCRRANQTVQFDIDIGAFLLYVNTELNRTV